MVAVADSRGLVAEERWLTVADIAARLQVHEQTVRRWLRSGALPGRNFGGKAGYRVALSELEQFVRTGNRPPAS